MSFPLVLATLPLEELRRCSSWCMVLKELSSGPPGRTCWWSFTKGFFSGEFWGKDLKIFLKSSAYASGVSFISAKASVKGPRGSLVFFLYAFHNFTVA
jgi:hypothetical protein